MWEQLRMNRLVAFTALLLVGLCLVDGLTNNQRRMFDIDYAATAMETQQHSAGCPPVSKALIEQHAVNNTIIITASDYVVYDLFGKNWIKGVQALGISSYLYGAADAKTAARLTADKVPCFQAFAEVSSESYSWGSLRWNIMTWHKVKVVQEIVGLGFSVFHADSDAVWFNNPLPYFWRFYDHADMLISSDLVASNNPVGDDGPEVNSVSHMNMNTGVYFVKPTQGGREIMALWVKQTNEQQSDQLGFYDAMRKDPKKDGIRFFYVPGTAEAKIALLPVSMFMNTYTLMVERLHLVKGVKPYLSHMVWGHGNAAGKIQRMRELELYYDVPSYYSEPKLLVFDLEPREVPADFDSWSSESMVQAHLSALKFQMRELVAAAAISMVLNRTLVLPKMQCFCYNNWFGLDKCRIPGDDATKFPFTCPLSQLFEVDELAKGLTVGPWSFSYREHSFLNNTRTPASQKIPTWVIPTAKPDCPQCLTTGRHHDGNIQLLMPERMKAGAMKQLLEPYSEETQLRFTDVHRLWGGFDDPMMDQELAEKFNSVLSPWCCRLPDEAKRLNLTEREIINVTHLLMPST